ncbi:MAG: helix-turn-helix transcriptional regulator [Bacteroidales bacterium]|nr:helix-turn-helix transcriptional regulator [Bacteroidales bacterium]
MNYLRIKDLLKEKGLTAKDLALDLNITENGISMIVNGKRQPRFELLQQIADRLDLEIWQLFKGSDKAVKGCIEYQGILYHIQTKQGLERLLKLIE